MKKIISFSIALMAAAQLLSCNQDTEQEFVIPEEKKTESDTIADWENGKLDIHFINTESGECIFCIFPDGTSMLMDAGETDTEENRKTSAHKIETEYIRHFLKATGSKVIDYAFLTHFHIDHFGTSSCARSQADGYAHMGMTAVYDEIKYRKIVDRGYPSYGDDPSIYFQLAKDGGTTSDCVGDWIGFVKHAVSQGCTAERFVVGSDTQFMPLKSKQYKFSVLNIGANGTFVDLKADGSKSLMKAASCDGENPSSCGIHITYGNFDFIACGDLTSSPQNVFARNYVKNYKRQIELFKAHHHLNANSWGSGMVEVGFSPKVVVAEAWGTTSDSYFPVSKIEQVVSIPCTLFATSPKSAAQYPDTFRKVKDYGGHFVVRVSEDGSYMVYKLVNGVTSFKVVKSYGPYTSK